MALINCPDCNCEVSDKADKCPKCACPIMTTKTVVIEKEVSKEGCFLSTLNVGCMVIFGIIGLIMLMALFS